MKTKTLRLMGIFLFFASPTLLHATPLDGIDMISQSYQISAQWDAYWGWGPSGAGSSQPYPTGDWSARYQVLPNGHITGGYALSSSDGSPVAASTSVPTPPGIVAFRGSGLDASASIGRFSFYNQPNAYDEGIVGQAPFGGYAYFSGTIRTSAQGIWDFRPTGSQLNVNIAGGYVSQYGTAYSGLTILLQDKTSSTTLLNLVGIGNLPGTSWGPPGSDFTFVVNPSDVYEFSVSGWSDTYDTDWAYESVTASISSSASAAGEVPEASSFIVTAFLLLPLGMQGVLYLRNRKQTA